MTGPRWYRKLLESTRGQVLARLRRGERTVGELAESLELTDNAIRRHLTALERDGLVEAAGVRRDGVGKPAHLYRVTAEGTEFFPDASGLLLDRLLAELERREDRHGVEELMARIGEGLAREQKEQGFPIDAELEEGVRAAHALLAEIGGDSDLERANGGFRIRGYACPLATVVRSHPEACTVARVLLESLLGVEVTEECRKGGEPPRCRFVIHSNGGAGDPEPA